MRTDQQATRPVFIIGEARSGTSLLYRTLQKHPSFRPRELNLVEADLLTHIRRAFLFGEDYPESFIRFMLADLVAWRAFLRGTRGLRMASVLGFLPGRWWPESMWPFRLGCGPQLLRSYLRHARRARGCLRLVEKTPTNTLHMPKLKAAFPSSRLLYIHRHPVDVLSSYRRRAQVDPNGGWAAIDVDSFCGRYEHAVDRVQRWLDGRHRDLLLVSYEAFVTDPATVFAEICAFLDEPFAAEAVEERQPQPGRWHADPHLWEGIIPRTKQWTDYLSPHEAALVQRRLASAMQLLGYAPYWL
jgi:hypothetical protein